MRATAVVTLPAPTNLVAVMVSSSQINLNWSASEWAQSYSIYRRDHGSGFSLIAQNVTVTAYADTLLPPDTTYVYHVRANSGVVSSPPSNSDLATTMIFSPIVAGETMVGSVHLNELLAGVNSVRAASGLPVIGWTNILPQGTPEPATGVIAYGSHILGLRQAMDDALDALALPLSGYTDPSLNGILIKAIHLTQLRSRTQ